LYTWKVSSCCNRGMQRSDDARGEYVIVCPPYQIRGLRNVCRHRKTTCPDFCHVQNDYATKSSPQVRINKRKNCTSLVPRLRNNSKGCERCETYVLGHRTLHGTFGEKKVKYDSERTLAHCSKNNMIWTYRTYSAESVTFNNFERWFFWKIIFIFFTTIESKESNRHAWYSPVTKFTLPQKMKPNRQYTIETWSVFTHKSNFEQGSLRGLGFCSLYFLLCFDYGVCSEMIMNLRMIKQCL